MPARRPTRGARFDLASLQHESQFTFTDREGTTTRFQVVTSESLNSTARLLPLTEAGSEDSSWTLARLRADEFIIELREAGIWFADIADILGYPSASSASAAYVRSCRRRNIEPLVREQNRRVRREIERTREEQPTSRPDFLLRDHFQAEFGDFGFGVEIEQVGNNRNQLVRIIEDLGYPVSHDTNYRHAGYTKWKAVPDASLRGGATGEAVSRILNGYDGLVELREVMLGMKNSGSRVNQSCGQHIHIGVENMNLRTQAMVIRGHALFQHVFDLLVNPPRRNHESYARHTPWLLAMRNARVWGRGQMGEAYFSKYQSLNLNHYDEYGTFEFRSLHGTLNPRHTVSWLQLHFDFFAFCEKIARLSVGEADSYLRFEDSAEVNELWRTMPNTMLYMRGLPATANESAWLQALEAIRSNGEFPESHIDTVRQQWQESFGYLETASEKLVVAPWFHETLCGGNTMQNRSALTHLTFNYRRATDPDFDQEWGGENSPHYAYEGTVGHAANKINPLGHWALRIMKEWACNDGSFVGNATVRKVMREMVVKQFPMLDGETLNINGNN